MAEENPCFVLVMSERPRTPDFRGSAFWHCRRHQKAGLSLRLWTARYWKQRNPCRKFSASPIRNFPQFAPFFPGSAPDSCYNGIIESANSKLTSVSPVDKDSALFFRRRVPVCIRNPAPASGILRDALLAAFRSSIPVSAIFFLFP